MKLASLFSGGKDSMYAIYLAQKQGHQVDCLLSVFANSDESHLLHHPNLQWTKLQSESMNIPQLTIQSISDNTDDELIILESLLKTAKEKFHIEGLVHGGIKSKFQKEKFESLCLKLDLIAITPLWDSEPEKYMDDLVDSNFDFIMTTVSSDGLDDKWLGKSISKSDVNTLKNLSKKFGFNLNFEGGEAETFVIDCPLFSNSIKIIQSEKKWDGYRGRFEIVDAGLNYNA
ncbi:MAG: diphthine--ammonia ligase [Thaumarchaeota archaeon]|jgi:ABC transporter with metal-binding/Fe-S-binding domain ATP-binding protein|nr:diphthine--ammonia ligase [Nitrososphaerota archaeon]MBT5842779.1 diphthine--ammonia ligase [Nitrososphaerota archaeon]MBT6468744.1 diphthine--ammonia ligase [Nitrososphaerota archaeon]